jgi:hypothetical protein
MVSAQHDVHRDDWEEGEGEWVNTYHTKAEILADSALEAVQKFYDKILNYKFVQDNLDFDEESCIYFDATNVDIDNNELTEDQLKQWRKGLLSAYVNSFTIEIRKCERTKI